METKFTPGPWGCKRSETGPWAIFGQDGSWVATTCKKQWVAEDLANARLIAAAPKMFAALEAVVESWTSQFESNGHLAPDWCKQARAALVEATGA